MNLDQALQTFIAESRELLAEMENALLGLDREEAKTELVHAIFRAAHTIKGSAGLFGLDRIVEFTHVVESVLDKVRDGKLEIADRLLALLLSCCDHIGALIEALAAGQSEPDHAMERRGSPLMEQLRGHLDGAPAAPTPLAVALPPFAAIERIGAAAGPRDCWHISLRFGPDALRNGMDPLSFLRYLGTLGTIAGIATLADTLPGADRIDPESCYLGFEIAFDSAADKAAIENVFEFVRDDCAIRILAPHGRIAEYLRLIREAPEEAVRLGDILVLCGSVTAAELAAALAEQAARARGAAPLGAILLDHGALRPVVLEAALSKQKQVGQLKAQERQSIRVDAAKLDHLINLVGELVIVGASANLIARRMQSAELRDCASALSGLVEEVRDSALELRMVKIEATFKRFQRVVHDVSREIGKDIGLRVSGEETELDKTVVEKIADPLTHLIRNAIDHGIEPAELRLARGKPARGSIALNAYHDAASIVIEVSDDGGGLNRDKILRKALERGLVEAGCDLSDGAIYDLIFEPGFSTAEQVTELSGRGVGMDVVKRNITALRGSVAIHSAEGVGTTVTVRLPLTLAIIDGFQVGLGKSVYVIPLDMIEECIALPPETEHGYTNLRGQALPVIRLREMFDVKGGRDGARRENIVVVRHAGKRAGLVVDALLGEFQTVIKPLGALFDQVECISGSSILGSGEVALILDIAALFGALDSKEARKLAA